MGKKNRYNIFMAVSVVMLVAAVVGAILVVFLWPREVRTSESLDEPTSIASLVCETDYMVQPFFSDTAAKTQRYVIKTTYQDGEFSNVSFSYVGIFGSDEEADAAESKMHAKFNLFMYDYNLDPEKYDPNFRNLENEARVDLFSSAKNMSDAFVHVILSYNDAAYTFVKSGHEDLSSIYNKIGYSCEYSEQI